MSEIERPKFPDGEPVTPLLPPDEERPIGFFGCLLLLIVLALSFLFATMATAHADEPAVTIFEQPGECSIDTDLRVRGDKRSACVERLETAARLARAERRVNERKRR